MSSEEKLVTVILVSISESCTTAKAILLYDGECPFCRVQAGHWEKVIGENGVVLPVQSGAGERYGFSAAGRPEALILIDDGGFVFTGAAAVFRLMSMKGGRPGSLLWRLYRRFQMFRLLADWGYRQVARCRRWIPV